MTLPDDVLAQAARAIGTPACIYDAARLRDGVAQLRRELPGVDFFYSLKANPNLSIVRLLAGQDTCRALRALVFGPDPAALPEIARKTADILPPAMVPKFWHHCPDLLLIRNSKIDRPRRVQAAPLRGVDHSHGTRTRPRCRP